MQKLFNYKKNQRILGRFCLQCFVGGGMEVICVPLLSDYLSTSFSKISLIDYKLKSITHIRPTKSYRKKKSMIL